jgi:hypothetical protein
LSSLENVTEIDFFITVMEGGVYVMASTTDPYPSPDTEDLKVSSTNRLTFKKEELGKDIYLAVKGLQYSEFTIGSVVKRQL